jgi:hemerythrin-like domain-containing protein
MKITSLLVGEHYLIEQVLNCLERMADRCESQRKLDVALAQDAIAFFRGFIERCHHGREDTQLLPAMHAMGISPERCLGCSMLEKREEGRSHLDAMQAAIKPAATGDAAALSEFTEHARAYIELLLEYIARKEDRLFPMIAKTLPEVDNARPETALHTASGDGQDELAYHTYIDLANRLADHFDVPRVVTAGSRRLFSSPPAG